MASSNFTENLGLCEWTGSDRPKRADFVADNGIIDRVLGGHVADSAIHMTAQEKDKALEGWKSFSYAGDGNATRTIVLDFSPKFAVVFKRGAAPVEFDNGVLSVNTALGAYGAGGSTGISITGGGVSVTQQTAAENGRRVCLNENGCQYYGIALK